MIGLTEQFASQIGWKIGKKTVVVEGTTDVGFLAHASILHEQAYGRSILDTDFAIVAAGAGDDGGVDGINRRLNTVRQLADADRDADGAVVHQFVGLYDNDRAGRNALADALKFDRRLKPYTDLFLLHPIMPLRTNLDSELAAEVSRVNHWFSGLDWEIEDLCSSRILEAFERANPRAILSRRAGGGRMHREFARSAKPDLKRFFIDTAVIDDAEGMIRLMQALRSYVGVDHAFIGI